MKPISEAWLCQIDVTNFCGRGCIYCSRYDRHIRPDQRFNMDLDFFEKAVLSLKDFPGKIGIIGGEPVYHPEFKEICFLLQKLLSKERRQALWLWSSGGVLFEKYRELIKETFAGVAYNQHTNYQQSVCKHQPITVAVEDVVESGAYRDKLIDDCWVQKTWCPTVTFKGAFFCEVAGALDIILDGPGGYTVEPGWWGRTPEEFQDQIDRYCLHCGMPVPMERQLLREKKEKISSGLLKLFKDHNLPNLLDRRVDVIDRKFSVEEMEKTRETWDPGNYRGDKQEDSVVKNKIPKMRGSTFTLDEFINVLPIKIGIFVEIGSYAGESMLSFLQSGKIEKAFAVDPWVNGWAPTEEADQVDMKLVEDEFDKTILPYNNLTKMKMSSEEAISHFSNESVDLVYIDANHEYKFIRQDIDLWLPKIRKGGIISGHAYGVPRHPGVKQAVDETFKKEQIELFYGYSWMVRL